MNSRKEQLNKWVEGESWHNPEFDECCPDFSCCGSKIVDKEVRIAFKEAYDEKNYKLMETFCFDFLKGMLAQKNYIVRERRE